MKNIKAINTSVLFLTMIHLSACGGGSNSSTSTTAPVNTIPLSADQQIYEDSELHGGAYTLSYQLPYGGGNLISGTDYIVATSTGGLSQSPSTGALLETPALLSLDTNLVIPPATLTPTRFLLNGQVLTRSATALRKISYVGSAVHVDYLADDGKTIVESSQFSNFSEVPLSGVIDNSPEELQAAYPFDNWVNANNFSGNAKWLTGAAYTKRSGTLTADIYIAVDCAASTTTTNTSPCQSGTTLNNFFPYTIFESPTHPEETDFAANGTISTIQGVPMWVANSPISAENSNEYRIYYQLNGNVYAGILEKNGSAFHYAQADGSVVNYIVTLNQASVNSIKQGIITGASVAGSQSGNSNEISSTLDLFGIGGHGINGALAPVDLLTHYNIPSHLNGAGQTIAIVDGPSTGDVVDDLNVFSQYYGLPQCTITNGCFQHIDLSNGAPVTTSEDFGGEVELDTQMVHGIAPAAKIILVTAKSNSISDLFAAINTAATISGVTAVNMSFGQPTKSYTANGTTVGTSTPQTYMNEDTLLANMQLNQGVVFFAASGDGGALEGTQYPAQSPFVTGVGGTQITTVPWTSPQSEVAWQYSGGGASTYASMPTWQSNFLSNLINANNSGMRATPDVSAIADGQHSAVAIYYKQRWIMAGGTSAATPLWAGITALFGQYLSNEGKSLSTLVRTTPGGFNGLLYQAKVNQGSNIGFYDIIYGSNNLTTATCLLCTATSNYDDVTGLGSPNVTKLFANF